MDKTESKQFRRALNKIAPKDPLERIKFYEQRLRDRRQAKLDAEKSRQETLQCR